MQRLKPRVLRLVVWLGDSKKSLRDFPEGAQKLLGDELQLIYASDAYRVVLALQIGHRIYVLHAFQKKSKKGAAIPKRDVDLIKKRYVEAQELAHEYEKAKTD